MRAHATDLLSPALLVVLSAFASVLLIPSERELALIHFKAKRFEAARERFEELLASGDLSVSVVKTMSELHLQYGEIDEAVALLERFVALHPGDLDARRRLGKYYQYAERPEEYERNLVAMNALRPEEAVLRELSHIHNARGDLAEQVEILEALTTEFAAGPHDLVDLAFIQARLGRHGAAVASLDRLEEIDPELVDEDVLELKLNLLIDSGAADRAYEEARRRLERRTSPALAARYADLFAFRRVPELGRVLLEPFAPEAWKHPALLERLARLEMDTGRMDDAYRRLEALRVEGRLPDVAVPLLVELELERGAPRRALALTVNRELGEMPDWLLSSLASAVVSLDDPAAAERIRDSMPATFLERAPLPAASLSLAAGRRVEAERALVGVRVETLDVSDRVQLGLLFERLGRSRLAYEILAGLLGRDELPESSLLGLSALAAELGHERELVPVLERYRGRGGDGERAWALVAAAAGRGGEVAEWLRTSAGALSDELLFDLYYAAVRGGADEVRLRAAEELHARRPGARDRRVALADSHVAAGAPGRALDLLRELPPDGESEERAYLEALDAARRAGLAVEDELVDYLRQKLSRAGGTPSKELVYRLVELGDHEGALPWLRTLALEDPSEWLYPYAEAAALGGGGTELIALLEAELRRPDLPDATRQAMTHLLREHGGPSTALPHLARLAETEGGDWSFAYEEALERLGRCEELVAFQTRVALDPGRPPSERRSRAYALVEAGRTEEARLAFFSLARQAPADSPDVSELLFLDRRDGATVSAPIARFLEARARAADGFERALWMRHLVDAGRPDLALEVAGESPRSKEVRLALLEAAAAARRGDLLSELVEAELGDEHPPGHLRRLGRLALEAGELATARFAFERLLALAPNDPRALKQLGLVAFLGSDYQSAARFLERYHETGRSDYETSYYYGEVLLRRGEEGRASHFFRRALDQIHASRKPSSAERITRAQLLHRLGRRSEAVASFGELLEEAPEDAHLRADYAAALLEYEDFGAAERILAGLAPERRTGSGGLRVSLLEANLLVRTLRHERALVELRELSRRHPQNATVLAALASAEEESGRWLDALEHADRALALDPSNEDVREARARVRDPYAPTAGVESSLRALSDEDSVTLLRIAGATRHGRNLQVGFDARRALARSSSPGSEDVARDRAEIFLRFDGASGAWMSGSLWLGGGAPGARVELGSRSARSRTRISAGYGLPYWDLAAGVRADASRDRLELSRESRWSRRLSTSATLHAQRYRAEGGEMGTLRSLGAAGDVTFRFRLGNPTLSLQYLLDAEYLGDSVGSPLRGALPLASREVHALGGIASAGLTEHLRADGIAGYSWDRLGGASPFFGAYLLYKLPDDLDLRFGFERRLYPLDTAVAETFWTGRFFWRF